MVQHTFQLFKCIRSKHMQSHLAWNYFHIISFYRSDSTCGLAYLCTTPPVGVRPDLKSHLWKCFKSAWPLLWFLTGYYTRSLVFKQLTVQSCIFLFLNFFQCQHSLRFYTDFTQTLSKYTTIQKSGVCKSSVFLSRI